MGSRPVKPPAGAPANDFALRQITRELTLVGTVASATGNELRIQLDDGSIATARGAYSVGQRVSFRPGGTVEGAAPALPFVDIPV